MPRARPVSLTRHGGTGSLRTWNVSNCFTGVGPVSERETLTDALPQKLLVRVERTEYAEIEVDVAGLIAEWADENPEPWEREDVIEVLHKIGVQDLMYSGDFIRVIEKDEEESIQ